MKFRVGDIVRFNHPNRVAEWGGFVVNLQHPWYGIRWTSGKYTYVYFDNITLVCRQLSCFE